MKTYPEIVIVESVIDALSLEMAGINNVISIQSTNGLGDNDIRLMKECGIRKITLMLDGDKPGRDASLDMTDIATLEELTARKNERILEIVQQIGDNAKIVMPLVKFWAFSKEKGYAIQPDKLMEFLNSQGGSGSHLFF